MDPRTQALSKGNSIVTHRLLFNNDIDLSAILQIWERDWKVLPSSIGTHLHFQRCVLWCFHSWCEASHSSGQSPTPGEKFAMRYSMVGFVPGIVLTSTPAERISRIRMKMHSYSIGVQLPQNRVRIACALTSMPPLQQLLFAAQRVNRYAGKLL